MYDMILLAVIVLPILATHLLGAWLGRDIATQSQERQARRLYALEWGLNLALVVQFAVIWVLLTYWGERLQLTTVLEPALMRFLRDWLPRSMTAIVIFIVIVLPMSLYVVLFYLPLLRLRRVIRGKAYGAGWDAALMWRALLAMVLPMMLLMVIIVMLPKHWINNSFVLIPLLVAFFSLAFASGPLLVPIIYPTAPLDSVPLEEEVRALCQRAGVRIGGIRRINMGSVKSANAIISGLLPWGRRIFLSDGLLEALTPEEILAILAHELGHIRYGHLWWYLGLTLLGMLILGPLAMIASMWLQWPFEALFLPLFLLYWGVFFRFLSRRLEHQADRFAVTLTDRETFACALNKLTTVNVMPRRWSKWDRFQTHPDLARRLRVLDEDDTHSMSQG